ncbi:hypothetical protein [Clostridium tertium]
MIKDLMDLINNVIIPFAIIIIVHFLNLEDSTASLLLSLLPVAIVTISYYYNKPKIYMKILTSIKARNNVKFKFKHYSVLDFDEDMNFNKFINMYIEELKKDYPVKIIDSEKGKLHSRINLDVDCIMYELNYNPETSEFNLSINSKITFKLFIREISKVAKVFREIAIKNRSIAFESSINSINIEFLNVYEGNEVKNPLFNKIYSDFTVINAMLKYKTKRNTIVELNNNSISFLSKNDIYDFVEDIRKQMALFG